MTSNAIRKVDGGVIAARGYRCGAVGAGIKTKAGALDVSIILSDRPAAAAALSAVLTLTTIASLMIFFKLTGSKDLAL